jgi:hypothetical protein
VNAEQAERMRRIGVLMALTEGDPVGQRRIAAFREGLQDLGWIEGRNIEIVFRWANPESGRLQVAAAELAGLKTDVILAGGTVSVGALLKETQTIPIVFAVVSDPIGSGFADSLSQAGPQRNGIYKFRADARRKVVRDPQGGRSRDDADRGDLQPKNDRRRRRVLFASPQCCGAFDGNEAIPYSVWKPGRGRAGTRWIRAAAERGSDRAARYQHDRTS